MKTKISLDELVIEKLKPDLEIPPFDCGDKDLNEFLNRDCKHQMSRKINVTYLCHYDATCVAFFTLSSDSIPINKDDKDHLGINYGEFPAVKIGRLAVASDYQYRGIGSELLMRVVGCVYKLSSRVGTRFVSVDAYPQSVDFYRKNNFIELVQDDVVQETDNVTMYFDPFRPFE